MKYYSSTIGMILLLALSIAPSTTQAQDATFSQFLANKAYLNPAYVGADFGTRFNFGFRKTWFGVPPHQLFNIYNSNFAVDAAIPKLGGGIGLMVQDAIEGAGRLRISSYKGMASKIIPLYSHSGSKGEQKLYWYNGVRFGVNTQSIDWSQLTFGDQLDPVLGKVSSTSATPPAQENLVHADFDYGTMLRFKHPMPLKGKNVPLVHEGGLAVAHLTEPNNSILGIEQTLPRRWSLHYTLYFPVMYSNKEPSLYLSPRVLFEQQGQLKTLNVGISAYEQNVFGGVYFRNRSFLVNLQHSDAVIARLGFKGKAEKLNQLVPGSKLLGRPNGGNKREVHYQFSYSYDLTVSRLATNSAGTHEIHLSVRISDTKAHRERKKQNKCYDFNSPQSEDFFLSF